MIVGFMYTRMRKTGIFHLCSGGIFTVYVLLELISFTFGTFHCTKAVIPGSFIILLSIIAIGIVGIITGETANPERTTIMLRKIYLVSNILLGIMAACFVTLLFICKEPIHYVGIFSLFLNLTFAIASLYFCYRCSGIEKNAVTTQGPGIIHLPTDRNEALRPPEYTAYPSEMPPQYTTSLPDATEEHKPPEYTAYPSYVVGAEMPPQYNASLSDVTEEHMPPQYTASPLYTAGAEMPPQYNASLSDVTEEHMPPQYTASPSYTAGAEMPPQYNASLPDATEEHMPPQDTASPSYTAGAEMPPQYNASLPDATEEHMPPQDTASPSYTAGTEIPPQYNASPPDADATKELCLHQLPNERE